MRHGLVDLGPLCGSVRCIRKAAALESSSSSSRGSLHLADLALLLAADRTAQSHALLGSVLAWCALGVELSSLMEAGSADPLQLPVVRGKKRSRRVAFELKSEVARATAEGTLARGGPKTVKALARLSRFASSLRERSAAKWSAMHAAQVVAENRRAFSSNVAGVTSVTCDATRLGGRETLWLALWNSSLQKAVWSPPQVPGSGLQRARGKAHFSLAETRISPSRKSADIRGFPITGNKSADFRGYPRISADFQ